MSAEWQRIQEADRLRHERETAERQKSMTELAENATPETLRHRAAVVVDELTERGKLTREQRRAAREIQQVYTAITIGMNRLTSRYEHHIAGGSVEDWRAGLIAGYHGRYVPWRNLAGRQPVNDRTVAELVLLVAVDNYGCRQIAQRWRMGPARVIRVLRESLSDYAEIAGWIDATGRPTSEAVNDDE
jgi:hypothetical protein